MKRQRKTLGNTRRAKPVHGFALWFVNGENRSFIAWLGSLLGVAFVIAYQMTLEVGFTPQVSLADGAFVLGKAAVIGLLLFAAIYIGIFAPAGSFRLLDIDVDKISDGRRRTTIPGLMRRCLCAQVFGGFFTAALLFFVHGTAAHHFWVAVVSSLISLAALVLALRSMRLEDEPYLSFLFSIFVFAASASFSLLIFLVISGAKDDIVSLMLVSTAWLALALVAGVLSVLRTRDLLPSGIAALLILVFILGALGQLTWAFRAVASAVGITQAGTVTIVVPESVCLQMQSALVGIEEMTCKGEGAGTLRKVEILSAWGSRWLIKKTVGKNSHIISFDGSGALMSKELRPEAPAKP